MTDDPRLNQPLAVHGGPPLRSEPMPTRRALGETERAMVVACLDHCRDNDVDPAYEGHFEKEFCRLYCEYMGGGHADAVATGTASVHVALAALDLPRGAEVISSPITDPGPINAIIALGLVPVLADTAPGRYNMGVEQVLDRVTPRTGAVLLAHCAGEAAEVDLVVEAARARGIRVVEDCSQAPGARRNGRLVGTFGDITATSTMGRKALHTGSSGGLVWTADLDLHRQALARADRGKPRWRGDFDDRNPTNYLFPALNWNTDEFACAIGIASLRRLDDTIARRRAFVAAVTSGLEARSRACRAYALGAGSSPFFLPVMVDAAMLTCDKTAFAEAVLAEGIGLNPHYACLVRDWTWAQPYLSDQCDTPNAREVRDGSFNLYLNERYGPREAEDVALAIAKVERRVLR